MGNEVTQATFHLLCVYHTCVAIDIALIALYDWQLYTCSVVHVKKEAKKVQKTIA
jgi:hypothetical protein